MYKALVFFTDSQDKDHRYYPGDTFPREGMEVSDGRMASLASTNNLRGIPVIKEVTGKAKTEQVTIKEPVAVPVEDSPEPAPKRRGRRRAD